VDGLCLILASGVIGDDSASRLNVGDAIFHDHGAQNAMQESSYQQNPGTARRPA